MKEVQDLYSIEDFFKALRDKKHPNKIVDMAPDKITKAYGLMFSILGQCKKAVDYVELLTMFLRFRENKKVNTPYEEIFTACCTIVASKVVESNLTFDFVNNLTEDSGLLDIISDIPAFKDINPDDYLL